MAVTLVAFIAFAFHALGPDAFGIRHSAFGIDERRPPLARVDAMPAGPARPGAVLRLVVKVTPREGIHIYAPPEKEFKPITLMLESPPGVRVGKPRYPASTVRTFEGQRVHVYDEPFSIEVPVTPGRRAAGELTVTGVVTYQACDDLVCYLPIKVPVRWDVRVQ